MNPGIYLISAVNPWPPIIALLVGGLIFGLTPLALAKLWAVKFSPAKPGAQKNAIYECGLESQADAWVQFKASYYLYAIIFLIFDVEAVFLLPFAVAFTGLTSAHASPCWFSCFCWLKGWYGPAKRACLTWN